MHWLKRYLLGLSLSLNVLASAVLGGDPTVTVSARAGHARERGATAGRVVCAILNVLDITVDGQTASGDHCTKAVLHEQERYRLGHHEDY